MANKRQQNTGDEQLANVEETLAQSEQWLEKNRNNLLICTGIVVALVLGFIAIKKFWYEPRVNSAAQAMVACQDYFAADSLRLALEGDEMDCIGFLGVADQYSMTPSAHLAKAYAGVCYYHLGQYEQAVKYLKKADLGDVNFAPAAKQLLGDAYVQLEQYSNAISAYEKAIKTGNDMIAPMSLRKMGHVLEHEGKADKALEAYKRIKNEYPNSVEAREIDKEIARIE